MYPRETIRFSRFGVSRRAHGGTIDRRIVEVKSDRSMTDQRSRHSVEIEEMSLVGPLLSNTPGNCSSRSIHHLRKSSISRSLAVNLSVSSSSSSSSSSPFFSFATIVGIKIGDWREREREKGIWLMRSSRIDLYLSEKNGDEISVRISFLMGRVTWTRYHRFDLGFPVNSIDRSTSLARFLSLFLSFFVENPDRSVESRGHRML